MSEAHTPPEATRANRGWRPRLLRPRLWTPMVAIAALTILSGRYLNGVHRQREAVRVLRGMGTQVVHENQAAGPAPPGQPRAPAWPANWLGEDDFFRVISANANAPSPDPADAGAAGTERFARSLRSLPHLRRLFATKEFLDDRAFEAIGRLEDLEDLSLRGLGGATGEGISRLRGLRKLRTLQFPGEGLTEEICRAIAEIPNLERLTLERGFGDREVAWLSRSRSIKDLYLLVG